jgi:polyisoprenyl-phosphate glycosyltransferase
MKKLISIVTTFRNEEPLIAEFIRRVQGVLAQIDRYDFEILFVDDDSLDKSLEVLEAHARSDGRIKVLVMSRRFGVYPCLIAGLKHASGDAVIYLETDLQDPPEIIPSLIQKWEAGADVVHTTRTERQGEHRLKILLTLLAYKVINYASDIPILENTGDYKLLSRRVVNEVVGITEPEPYFRGMVSWVGFQQTQIFYKREARVRGKSKRGLLTFAPLNVFISAILSFSTKPLFFVAAAGFLLIIIAPFLLPYFWWAGDSYVSTKFLASALIIILVVIEISLGIIALYLARVCSIVRNRPLYLLREKIGFPDQTTQNSFFKE